MGINNPLEGVDDFVKDPVGTVKDEAGRIGEDAKELYDKATKGPDKAEETEEEKELARISQERWKRYEDMIVPVENAYMDKVEAMNTQGAYDQAVGGATMAVQQSAGEQGFDPNANDGGQYARGLATARAGAGANATDATRSNYAQGLNSVVSMGQGQSSDAMRAFGDIAAQSADKAVNKAQRSFNNRQSWLNTAGTLVGTGVSLAANNPSETTQTPGNTYYHSNASDMNGAHGTNVTDPRTSSQWDSKYGGP